MMSGYGAARSNAMLIYSDFDCFHYGHFHSDLLSFSSLPYFLPLACISFCSHYFPSFASFLLRFLPFLSIYVSFCFLSHLLLPHPSIPVHALLFPLNYMKILQFATTASGKSSKELCSICIDKFRISTFFCFVCCSIVDPPDIGCDCERCASTYHF